MPTSGICTACQIIHASRSAFGEEPVEPIADEDVKQETITRVKKD